MPEAIAWPEGSIYLWTGTATASALVGYAEDVNPTFVKGIDNYQTLDTAYHDIYTGQRVDLQIGSLWTTDSLTVWKFFEAGTAVHAHLKATGVFGSAGHFLHSGAIDTVQYAGSKGRTFEFKITMHANRWSAY